jgi:hypothetical protein
VNGGWEHTTQWRDRFERLQKPTINPAGDPLAEFVSARIIEAETAPRFDLTDELHDTPGGAIAQRYAEHLRRDCVAFRRIVVAYLDVKAEREENAADLSGQVSGLRLAVEAIATHWAEHPDFQAGWKIE